MQHNWIEIHVLLHSLSFVGIKTERRRTNVGSDSFDRKSSGEKWKGSKLFIEVIIWQCKLFTCNLMSSQIIPNSRRLKLRIATIVDLFSRRFSWEKEFIASQKVLDYWAPGWRANQPCKPYSLPIWENMKTNFSALVSHINRLHRVFYFYNQNNKAEFQSILKVFFLLLSTSTELRGKSS